MTRRARATGRTRTNGTPFRKRQRRALGALFTLLALGFAGIAVAAASSDTGAARRAVVAVGAGALALWLATLAMRALR